ncbi:hypothetical protein LWI29_033150 [Acer saccharum]|uniref:Secreted protein n=1 Tax=Acer saccharum TaxID=4024 RepID=A0AA39W7H4_ACESA|nr:hypothetical protein LWI29_033150 [Acer saccharum]
MHHLLMGLHAFISWSDNASSVSVDGTSSIPVITVTTAIPSADWGLTDITSSSASVMVVSKPRVRMQIPLSKPRAKLRCAANSSTPLVRMDTPLLVV